jgi:Predicted transcriptional regulators
MSDNIGVWCSGKEWCPISATASVLSKKWHPVIIHRLLKQGRLGFNELKREVDGVSSKVLSESLDDLEEKDLIHRDVVNEKPVRVKYQLTQSGKDLKRVIEEMKSWGRENLEEAKKEESVA